MVHVVMGVQWGDEGKGKVVDIYAKKSDYVVRFHGGNNAGHTVVNHLGKFPLHLVPCGIFYPKTIAIIGNGTILDLDVLVTEIKLIEKTVPDIKKRLIISPRCHIIMPYHKLLDRLYEEAKGKVKTGTTGRGIGPTYADKVSYNGLRLYDFLNPEVLKQKLTIALLIKNKIIEALGEKPLKFADVYETQMKLFKKIKPLVREAYPVLHEAVKKKKYVLYEGAHGFFLDNDWGTYPFCTASSIVASNITAGSGIPAQRIKKITGIAKAYTTRVGGGPFPTELLDKTGEDMRVAGNEYGTTTGRPRRCGWLDLVLLKFAVELNGITELALTKIDVLDTFKSIKLCTGYTYKGKKVGYVDGDAVMLGKVKPIYKTVKGWKTKLSGIKKYSQLPSETKAYIKLIEQYVGIPVNIVSVGPDRKQTILR